MNTIQPVNFPSVLNKARERRPLVLTPLSKKVEEATARALFSQSTPLGQLPKPPRPGTPLWLRSTQPIPTLPDVPRPNTPAFSCKKPDQPLPQLPQAEKNDHFSASNTPASEKRWAFESPKRPTVVLKTIDRAIFDIPE